MATITKSGYSGLLVVALFGLIDMSTTEPTGPTGRYEDGRRLWIIAGALAVGLLGLAFFVFNEPAYYGRTGSKGVTAPKGNPTPAATTSVPTAPAIPAPSPTGTQDKNPEE